MTIYVQPSTTMLEQLLQHYPLGLPGMIRVGGSDDLLAIGIDNGNGNGHTMVGGSGGVVCAVPQAVLMTQRCRRLWPDAECC